MTKRTDRDAHAKKIIEGLFLNKEFVVDIKNSRAIARIPENGFETFEQFYQYLEDEIENKKGNYASMYLSLNSYAQKYGLPLSLLDKVEAVIALGKNYTQFQNKKPFGVLNEFSITGAHEGLRIERDRTELHIFPGASQREVVEFIKKHWSVIAGANMSAESIFGKNIVVRNISKRDKKEIYSLYKAGEINSMGIWNDGSKDEDNRPECIRSISPERIVQIISEERKREETFE